MNQFVKGHYYFLFLIFFHGCFPVRENPFDPKNNDYIYPNVYVDTLLSSVKHNDIVTCDSVIIIWKGASDLCEYRYQFNNNPWSIWSDQTFWAMHIDDGTHLLRVQAHYTVGNNFGTDSISFTVSALTPPALFISPREQHITTDTTSIKIVTKNIPSCFLMHLVLSGATIQKVQKIHELNNINVNVLNDSSTIDITVLPGALSVSGDCEVVRATILINSIGTHLIEIGETSLRDSTDKEIDITTVRGAIVKKVL